MITLNVQSRARTELVDVTHQIQDAIRQAGLERGICAIFVPHTTAGLTLNENWDPDVKRDMLLTLGEVAPADPRHRHGEGNSPAHLQASLMGASGLVLVEDGQLQLGSWQGVYLAEFDGPRRRKLWIKLIREE